MVKLFGNAVQPAIVQTNDYSSFDLFRELKKTEAGRAAKPGDIAPEDIIVDGSSKFVDAFSSHAPEEFVPGRVFDSLNAISKILY